MALSVGALLGAGCTAKTPEMDSSIFVATVADFDGFHDWMNWPAMPASTLPPIDGGDGVDAGPTGGGDAGSVHPTPLTVYINQPPPHGSTSFPVGTVVVKETSAGALTSRTIFAMAKRGGDFNPAGAVNWEWFELSNNADGTVNINWRGVEPSGSMDPYASNPNVCNECHLKAAANDDVWSSALQLSNF
ncbi:MAG TPA: hypothetical protein VHG72_11190 [Polyangia bacterium]|nr:hypothetical protein [Polyangia bacterium]